MRCQDDTTKGRTVVATHSTLLNQVANAAFPAPSCAPGVPSQHAPEAVQGPATHRGQTCSPHVHPASFAAWPTWQSRPGSSSLPAPLAGPESPSSSHGAPWSTVLRQQCAYMHRTGRGRLVSTAGRRQGSSGGRRTKSLKASLPIQDSASTTKVIKKMSTARSMLMVAGVTTGAERSGSRGNLRAIRLLISPTPPHHGIQHHHSQDNRRLACVLSRAVPS